jgi:hypothetical protein
LNLKADKECRNFNFIVLLYEIGKKAINRMIFFVIP